MGTQQPEVIIGRILPSEETVVEGFTITGAPPTGSGALIRWVGKATVRDCVFRDLDTGANTGGLQSDGESGLDVIDCEFVNCVGTTAGGIWADGKTQVIGSSFEGCSDRAILLTGEQGGMVEQAVISNCEFRNNSSSNGGGAIGIGDYTGGFDITNCWFEGNVDTGTGGGAVHFGDAGVSGPNSIEHCVFLRNSAAGASGQGGAILVFAACVLRGNTFYENSQGHPLVGGAAVVFFDGPSSLENNIITNSVGAEAIRVYGSTVVASACNVFWENTEGNGDNYVLGPTDREVDPEFCGAAGSDLTVAAGSPCLPPNSNGCGLIGALGQGCGAVSVGSLIETRSWGSIKALYR
jgi:hypothetical protein